MVAAFQEEDKRYRRRVEWLNRHQCQGFKPISKGEEERLYESSKRLRVYYDCSAPDGGSAFIVLTEYGYRCAGYLVTPFGNTLFCLHCSSPVNERRERRMARTITKKERGIV